MYKSASRFMKSQPVSRFFRDHLNVEDTQQILQKQSVMQWIWDSTKRKGLVFVLEGVSEYELVLIFLALFDEDRLDTEGIILAEALIARFYGKPVVLDGELKAEVIEGIKRAYDKYRMR
jgi:hypothetical protein